MGSSASTSSFQQNNWRKLITKGNKSILYNDITMKSVEQHQSVLDMAKDQIQEIYSWRSKMPEDSCVVDLYQYGIKSAGMCSGYSEVYAITQRIHLLQNIGSYSKAEAFNILLDLSKGVKILFKKFGPFTPRLDCIGINSDGKAKCWINQNFSQLEPKKEVIPVDSSELATVNNMIRLVDSKVYEDKNFPIEYPRNLNFEGVEKYILQVFKDLEGFKVDRVYLDRTQFAKKYKELRQLQEKEKRTVKMASQMQKRFREIDELHRKLNMQQKQLAQKQMLFERSKNPQRQYHQRTSDMHKINLVNTSQSQNKVFHPKPYHYQNNQITQNTVKPMTKMQKQIEMVDSMIVLHNQWDGRRNN